MNEPGDAGLRAVSLDDKYDATDGKVYLTGTQALVRLPIMQRQRDLAAGLNTGGYISGYRGSPVGGYDQALWKARRQLQRAPRALRARPERRPGRHRDLGNAAVGTASRREVRRRVRRSGTARARASTAAATRCATRNQAGSSPHGGVLAIAGDDHGAKSSTMAAQTDFIFSAVSMPVLAPATVQDYIDLGLHGFAMSRFSGLWVGFKAVTDTIEIAGIVDVSPRRVRPVLPEDVAMPPGGLNLRWPEETFLKLEERLTRYKLPAALAYARANRLDANVFGRDDRRRRRAGATRHRQHRQELARRDAGAGRPRHRRRDRAAHRPEG